MSGDAGHSAGLGAGRGVFEGIVGRMTAEHDGVAPGRMMSRAAVAYKGKVFSFLGDKDEMVFRLGKGYDPDAAGLVDWSYLSPFKNKPPMRGWIGVRAAQADRWSDLAEKALAVMRAERG
ncbi:MAG TPA: hypothetical protein VM325_07930 [Alphaproteobacteria bacterium]|nr:hypothetical protein [Alphaproteobacteria bacterium]